MSSTAVKEKVKKTETVVLAYIDDSVSAKRVKSPVLTKNGGIAKRDMFDSKSSQMEVMLGKFQLPARESKLKK